MDATQRFSSRADNYWRYRPSYPGIVLALLWAECSLTADSVVADVGSGTGISAELFLRQGNQVYGVEPNEAMRAVSERLLAGYPRFRAISARAEATTLLNGSVDFVVAGQAFHWFEPIAARAEFVRILRPGGWVVLMWNSRRSDAGPFMRSLEILLQRYGTDYCQVSHRRIGEPELTQFFGSAGYRAARFDNLRVHNYTSLEGGVLSASYAPGVGHPNHESMLAALRELFDAHEAGGQVIVQYDTQVYYGRLN